MIISDTLYPVMIELGKSLFLSLSYFTRSWLSNHIYLYLNLWNISNKYKEHLSTTSGYFIEVEHVHSLAMAWVFVTTIRWRYQWEQTFPSSYCANTGLCTGNTESHGIERTDWSRKETKWDIMTFEAFLWVTGDLMWHSIQ